MQEISKRVVEEGMRAWLRFMVQTHKEEFERLHSMQQMGSSLREGSAVLLIDLIGSPELNGKKGTCEKWHAERERWSVRLSNDEVKAIKPCNLMEMKTQ